MSVQIHANIKTVYVAVPRLGTGEDRMFCDWSALKYRVGCPRVGIGCLNWNNLVSSPNSLG